MSRNRPFVFLLLIAGCGGVPTDFDPSGTHPVMLLDGGTVRTFDCAAVGMTEAELLASCGDPCDRQQKTFETTATWSWCYDAGPPACVSLESGVVTTVEAECRG